jgi:predicted secreted protein
MRHALLLLAALVPFAAPAQDAKEPLFNLVSLSAQAERDVPNDLLIAVLAAEAEGPDPTHLAGAVNKTMQNALELARGVRAVRAQSAGYQTWPVTDKARISRWRVRQELRLESSDIAAASVLIGKLQAILVVSQLSLSVSDEARRRAENALIGEAIAAFEERARVVRDAMKAKGYRVRDLQVGGGTQPRPMVAQLRALSAESAAPALEPGTSRILITVSGTLQLQ